MSQMRYLVVLLPTLVIGPSIASAQCRSTAQSNCAPSLYNGHDGMLMQAQYITREEQQRRAMNAPTPQPPATPPYHHSPLFPLGPDETPYRKLTDKGVRVEKVMAREVLVIEREALRALTKAIAAEHRDSVAAMARTTDGKK